MDVIHSSLCTERVTDIFGMFQYGKVDQKYTRTQGLAKGAKLCLNPYFFWLAGEMSWLAVEVRSPCRK